MLGCEWSDVFPNLQSDGCKKKSLLLLWCLWSDVVQTVCSDGCRLVQVWRQGCDFYRLRSGRPAVQTHLHWDFSGWSYTSDFKLGTPVATPRGVVRSGLGLVGPVSVYCDWVRWKVWPVICKLCLCGRTFNGLSWSVPEIHRHVAGMLGNQPTNVPLSSLLQLVAAVVCQCSERFSNLSALLPGQSKVLKPLSIVAWPK